MGGGKNRTSQEKVGRSVGGTDRQKYEMLGGHFHFIAHGQYGWAVTAAIDWFMAEYQTRGTISLARIEKKIYKLVFVAGGRKDWHMSSSHCQCSIGLKLKAFSP